MVNSKLSCPFGIGGAVQSPSRPMPQRHGPLGLAIIVIIIFAQAQKIVTYPCFLYCWGCHRQRCPCGLPSSGLMCLLALHRRADVPCGGCGLPSSPLMCLLACSVPMRLAAFSGWVRVRWPRPLRSVPRVFVGASAHASPLRRPQPRLHAVFFAQAQTLLLPDGRIWDVFRGFAPFDYLRPWRVHWCRAAPTTTAAAIIR